MSKNMEPNRSKNNQINRANKILLYCVQTPLELKISNQTNNNRSPIQPGHKREEWSKPRRHFRS